jgi:hypothetical protein
MRNARLKREDAFSTGDDHRQLRDGVVVVMLSHAREQLVVDVAARVRHRIGVSSATFSAAVKSALFAYSSSASIFSVETPFRLPTAALTPCQNSQPFHAATRRLSSALSAAGTRFVSCWRAAYIAFAARKYAWLRA